jgi:hypothetical protein
VVGGGIATPFSHFPHFSVADGGFAVHARRSIEFSCIVACLREAGSLPAARGVDIKLSGVRPPLRRGELTAWWPPFERVRTHHEGGIRQAEEVNRSLGHGGPCELRK